MRNIHCIGFWTIKGLAFGQYITFYSFCFLVGFWSFRSMLWCTKKRKEAREMYELREESIVNKISAEFETRLKNRAPEAKHDLTKDPKPDPAEHVPINYLDIIEPSSKYYTIMACWVIIFVTFWPIIDDREFWEGSLPTYLRSKFLELTNGCPSGYEWLATLIFIPPSAAIFILVSIKKFETQVYRFGSIICLVPALAHLLIFSLGFTRFLWIKQNIDNYLFFLMWIGAYFYFIAVGYLAYFGYRRSRALV